MVTEQGREPHSLLAEFHAHGRLRRSAVITLVEEQVECAVDSDDGEVVVANRQRQKREGHKRHIRLRHPLPD
jgi:hypothetical protein